MEIKKGTRVFITGAASGMGMAAAIKCADLGAELFLTDANGEGLDKTAALIKESGGDLKESRALDIRDYEAVKNFADHIVDTYGPVEVLMNIAGIALFARPEDTDHERWKRVIDTNLWGPIHGVECFLPGMVRQGRGHIVTVSSAAALIGWPWHVAYSTTKFGVLGMSEVLKIDMKKHNIGITVVCPGAVNTAMVQSTEIMGLDREEGEVKRYIDRFQKHAISPEDVADMIVEGVRKNRFLVITSFDIKLLYFLKKFFPPAYRLALGYMSKEFERLYDKGKKV